MRMASAFRRCVTGIPLLLVHVAVLAAGEEAPSSAAATPAEQTVSHSPDPLAMTSLWQLTLGMLLVLGLILAMAWLLKRSGRFQTGAGGGLRILGGLSMGSRERVVLIQAGETQLLLGVAPGRVQTLHVLDKPLQSREALPAAGFAEKLGRLLNKDKTP